jgi:hypothetical protein
VPGTERAAWWPLLIAMERAVGRRLERATRTDEFAALLTMLNRVDVRVRQTYRHATADSLHRYNLPAWSDLLRLSEQTTALERRVADLALQLERRPRLEGVVKPRSRPRRRRSSVR